MMSCDWAAAVTIKAMALITAKIQFVIGWFLHEIPRAEDDHNGQFVSKADNY